MKIVLSIVFLLVLFVGMTIPSFAQVSDSLQVSIDKTEYLPGSYVKISASSSDVIPFEGLKFSVIDTNGKIIEKGILYPTNGQFNSSVFISTVNPVYGDYEIKFQYSDIVKSILFQVISDVKDDVLITLNSDKKIYGPGETVDISGRLNQQWVRFLNLEINQSNNIALTGAGYGDVSNLFKIIDTLNVEGDGKFSYSFKIPNDSSSIGNYKIKVSESLGSKIISILVVEDPENYEQSESAFFMTTDKSVFTTGLDKKIIVSGFIEPKERSSFETPTVKLFVRDSQNSDLSMTTKPKGQNTLYYGGVDVNLDFTAIPDSSGFFTTSIDINRQLFPPGNYLISATYEGFSSTSVIEVIEESFTPLALNKQVYGLGEDVILSGQYPTTECCITISITKPDGSITKSGVVLDAQKFSWIWKTPSEERYQSIIGQYDRSSGFSNYGIYKMTVSSDSISKDLFFKVSANPESDSLSKNPIMISAEKSLYLAGEQLNVFGTVIVSDKTTGITIPDRVQIQVVSSDRPFEVIHESFVYPSTGGEFDSSFELPQTIFKTGDYEIRSNYLGAKSVSLFSVVNDFTYGGTDTLSLEISSDKTVYEIGETVVVYGKPNKLIYLEAYDVSVIKKSETEITCGSFICGIHKGSITTILPGPNGSFVYEFVIPNSSDSVGDYEVTVDADFETKHLVFSVVDKIPVKSPQILFEKQNRITENSVGVKLESKINENSILLPRVLSGSLISILGDESKVNLKVSNELGQCIIGQDDDCLVSESTRKPGQIFDTISVNGESFKVRYSGIDARLEKFNILPENDESFLPLENWTVEVIKENQPSKLYYKVTYKLQQ